ncbi:DUF5677 domain-containing protein [Saccharothrix stipae]
MKEFTAMTHEETHDLLAARISAWQDRSDQARKAPGVSMAQFVTVLALAAHTHRVARGVLVLYGEDLRLEAVPLVRSAYEHSLTAMWLAQYDEAVIGFVNRYDQQRRLAVDTIAKAGWSGAKELADRLEQEERRSSRADGPAGNFGQLCNELEPGGDEAYAIYRILSSLSHAGALLADHYMAADPLEVSLEPRRVGEATHWLYLTAVSVVKAAWAVDMLEFDHPRRGALQAAGDRLGVQPESRLSQKHHARVQRGK